MNPIPDNIGVLSTMNTIVEITLKKGRKRCWRYVREILNAGPYHVDLRKVSKGKIPLLIECSCPGKTRLEIRKVKDFPLKNRRCKCGVYLIKWVSVFTTKRK